MAGNKMNTKTKGKDDKGRGNKGVTQSNEDGEDLDFALLRKPIPTSVTGFAQARKIFDFATEELKDLLSNECDMLYECKVCRNIFRSLANFISHKRVYCKERFNSSVHSHFMKNSSTLKNEMLQIKRVEEEYQESRRAKNEVDTNENDEEDDRVPLTKDLTAIYEKLIKSKGAIASGEQPQVSLKKIPSSNNAVFQSMIYDENLDEENMRTQVTELDHMLSCDKAVLQKDGKFTIESSNEKTEREEFENVIQISDDDENEDTDLLKCKICDLQFSTNKTLKFHMKYKHLESRLVYPCPDCLEIFSTSWSVYRHLFKVHRKTAAQIRRLRESIQAKAFRMNNPPAFYEKRKKDMRPIPAQKITEEERLDQENQAWMDNMEGDGEVPRCGGCGRTFERRAALAAHTHTCQPRSRALARRVDSKRIEIQIRKDYNKEPNATMMKTADTDTTDIKDQNEDSKPDDEKESDVVEEKDVDEAPMDVEDDQKSDDSTESPEKVNDVPEDVKPATRLPFAIQAEKSNFAAFRQRIHCDMNFLKLQCRRCNKKLSSVLALYDHMAEHVKWMRYACKLCNFKDYNFDKIPEHVKVVHKLKGDSDFYYSTVKAIDGTEAMILSRCLTESEPSEDANEPNETSPESRRPSRCSSDSSRLSDDSSSSSTFKEGAKRKRKMFHNKVGAKRKKDSNINDEGEDQKDGETIVQKAVKSIINDSSANLKSYEENSSDLDDIEEKMSKRHNLDDAPSVASRRPVRKRTKPKNEDFEYDLSNLLKMEAQGYRESQTVTTTKAPVITTARTQTVTTSKTFVSTPKPQPNTTTKTSGVNKKKLQAEVLLNFENINKDCCGALYAMSKKSVDIASAHMKVQTISLYSNRPNIFVRPTIPRILSRGDKASPKKDVENVKEIPSLNKVSKYTEQSNSQNVKEQNDKESVLNVRKIIEKTPGKDDLKSDRYEVQKCFKETLKSLGVKDIKKQNKSMSILTENQDGETSIIHNSDENTAILEQNGTDNSKEKTVSNVGVPSVVPLKLRRQSLELMKNPIINKNMTDFSKAGMKTKILVIKPINRNTDGLRQVNAPLKFQTIKLKESGKGSSEDKSTDQIMVVKVPKVPCTIAEKINPTMSANSNAPVGNTNNHEVADIHKEEENSKKSTQEKVEDIATNDDSKQTAINESPTVSDIKAESVSEVKEPSVSEINNESVVKQSEKSVNVTENPKVLEVAT